MDLGLLDGTTLFRSGSGEHLILANLVTGPGLQFSHTFTTPGTHDLFM